MRSPLQRHRSHAYSTQKTRCIYCTAATWDKDPAKFMARYGLTLKQAKRFQCTAEHLSAKCDGGGDYRSNIAAACLTCNQRRHLLKPAPDPERYKQMARAAVARGQWHRRWAFKAGVLAASTSG
jgi:hypothetical protein